jgi:chromosome segregation and condensation protein ScpB
MNEKKMMAALEAILFAMGDSVEISRLSQALEIPKGQIL